MARPPAQTSTPAITRIEMAFWELLASMKYADITIATLARHAQVNHNTIYYHYRGLDDIACSLIDELADSVPLDALADAITSDDSREASIVALVESHPEILDLFAKAALIARSGSSEITSHLRTRIEERWLGVLGLPVEQASKSLRLLLTFMTGGMLSLLASIEGEVDILADIVPIFDHGMSRAVVSTLTTLAHELR